LPYVLCKFNLTLFSIKLSAVAWHDTTEITKTNNVLNEKALAQHWLNQGFITETRNSIKAEIPETLQ